eukprot:9475210-Pyramimonas_sp.AAC.1
MLRACVSELRACISTCRTSHAGSLANPLSSESCHRRGRVFCGSRRRFTDYVEFVMLPTSGGRFSSGSSSGGRDTLGHFGGRSGVRDTLGHFGGRSGGRDTLVHYSAHL